MKVPTLTFAGGVLSKGLYGRVDLNKYQTGLKKAENFNVAVEGGVFKRFGLYYVGKPKYQDRPCKLVPWRIADDDSYILEVGDFYIRFIRFGGYVAIPGGHVALPGNEAVNVGGYMEVPTPYTAAEARELKWTFANDIAYISHDNHAHAQLKRLGLYDWSLNDTGFNPHGTAPTGLTGVWQHFDGTNWGASALPSTNLEANYDENPTDYKYMISATMPNGLETMPSAPITVTADLGHPSFRVKLTWTALAGAQQYTIYKGKTGIFGFIGYVDAADPQFFEDRNFAPSYDVVPYKAFPGFTGGGNPRVSEFYKQRLAYAAPPGDRQTVWFSRPLFFDSMTTSIPSQDDDMIKATLVGHERQTINHMIQLKKFIVFTDAGEWLFGTDQGQALTGASFDPVQVTSYGSDPFLSPKPIGDRILFIQNISGTIRDMGYTFSTDSYQADDLSRLARDLFKNKKVIAWDYAAYPSNLVSCVCDDGSVNQMAYVREHEIWGWSTFVTQGIVTDTASVAEITEHGEYFQVTRTINGVPTKFIERTEIVSSDLIEDSFFVDCGLAFEDKRAFTTLVYVSPTQIKVTCAGHGRSVGDQVRVQTPEFDMNFLVGSIVGSVLTLNTKLGKTIDTAPTITSGTIWMCASSFTGFSHLANQSGIVALADGKVVRDLTVSAGGVVTIPFQASKVKVGFPYTATMQTLDLDVQGAAGQYNIRAVDEIIVHLENSRGIFVGASDSSRPPIVIPGRADEDYDQANSPLDGPYRVPSHVAWERTAGVIIQSFDPLPARILNVVPDIKYGN